MLSCYLCISEIVLKLQTSKQVYTEQKHVVVSALILSPFTSRLIAGQVCYSKLKE